MPIAAAMANPTTYRFMLCPTSDRKSDVGHTSHARSTTSLAVGTRNEFAAPAQSCQTPRAARKTSTPSA